MTAWSPEADEEARGVLRRHAKDLHAESVRVAVRAEADTVSPAYVTQAATTLRLRRSVSPVGDVFLAIGPALATFAGGIGAVVLTDSNARVENWLAAAAFVGAIIGLVLTGAGAALKLRR